MAVTLGLVANVYNEAWALPGWLEMAHSFFDHVSVYHAGPRGAESTDGTIEILEKWKVPIHRGKIDEGFGICRTAAVRSSPCDWVMLLDADERFYQFAPVLACTGESTPPDVVSQVLQEYDTREPGACPSNWENLAKLGANLKVGIGDIYAHGAWLRSILDSGSWDAVCTIRRHWHDFSWKRPTQNWHTDPDYQIRIMRNVDHIHFNANTRMHETLLGYQSLYSPNQTHGPFMDHYHLWYKRFNPKGRAHAVRIYDAIHQGLEPPLE
jgi:glycosyltransferase involved in cell wall biosynthesis